MKDEVSLCDELKAPLLLEGEDDELIKGGKPSEVALYRVGADDMHRSSGMSRAKEACPSKSTAKGITIGPRVREDDDLVPLEDELLQLS